MGKTVVVINQKGGVGKTCTTYNTSYALAKEYAKKTLLICMDPSGDSIEPFHHEDDEFEYSIADVLLDKTFNPKDAIYQAKINQQLIDNLYFIPTTIELSLSEYQLLGKSHKEKLLQRQLEKIKGEFDFILIDCPPLLSIFSIIPVYTADFLAIPLRYERDAVKGLKGLFKTITEIKEEQYYDYKILRTGYDARKKDITKKIDPVLAPFIEKNRVFSITIRQDEELNKAKAENLPIFIHSPKSRGANDYLEFTKELLNV